MRKLILILLVVLVVIPAIVLGTAWYLLQNENFLKRQVSRVAFEQTGRELNIDGLLKLDIGRQTRLQAEGIRFQNAGWADDPEMVRLGRLDFTVDIPSLWQGKPFIPEIAVDDCAIRLIKNADGEANWDVLPPPAEDEPPSPPAEGLPVRLSNASISSCRLVYDAPGRDRPLTVEVDELSLHVVEDNRVEARGGANVNGRRLAFSGAYAPLDAFIAGGPVKHELDLSLGELRLSSSGSMQDARGMTGVNLDANISGPDIGRILAEYELPPVSEGEFDFRARLSTSGRMTEIDIDGDLGSLEVTAKGELDRLNQPQYGKIQITMEGPNLQALGEALGEEGLVAEPFKLNGEAVFDQGVMRVDPLVFETSEDRLEARGTLGPAPEFAQSDLQVQLSSREIGRWRGRLGLPEQMLGSVEADAQLTSDKNGFFTVNSNLSHEEISIRANGALGSVQGVLQPELVIDLRAPDLKSLGTMLGVDDLPPTSASVTGRLALQGKELKLSGLNVDLPGNHAEFDGSVFLTEDYSGSAIDLVFKSTDLSVLGSLIGRDALPQAEADVRGSVSLEGQQLSIESLDADLAGHSATIQGIVSLAENFTASQLEVSLESPDVAALGTLFGQEGLPSEPVALDTSLNLTGNTVEFRLRNGATMGDIILNIDGRVPDRSNPMAMDANFDVRLPSLTVVQFLVPDRPLPDQPFTVRGSLQNEEARTRLSGVQATLGQMQASVDGEIGHDQRMNLNFSINGPDASVFSELAGRDLPADSYSIATQLQGTPQSFDLDKLAITLGESRVNGDLAISLGERTAVSGRIDAPKLDLRWLQREAVEETEEAVEEPASREWLFDETPVLSIDDYGVDTDLDIRVALLDLRNTSIKDIHLGIGLAPNFLQLNPLSLSGLVGSALGGELLMDARNGPTELRYQLNGSALRVGIMAVEGQDVETYPPIDLQIQFDGRGTTRREMMSGLNGKVRVYFGSGDIASAGVGLIFSDFLTELFSLLNPFAKTSEYTRLECGVIAADIVDGQVAASPLIFHTSDITIVSEGGVDLKTEELDFSFNTKPRKGVGLSAGVLVNPFIKVGGRLVSPAVELDPERAAVSSGLAVATMGISLLAKSMSDRFLSSKDPCGDARNEIEQRESTQ